jgi:hypothetical protein
MTVQENNLFFIGKKQERILNISVIEIFIDKKIESFNSKLQNNEDIKFKLPEKDFIKILISKFQSFGFNDFNYISFLIDFEIYFGFLDGIVKDVQLQKIINHQSVNEEEKFEILKKYLVNNFIPTK